uniref:X-ray radiation resistance-associated protein 1 isoform X1 n=2 Tax=Pristiophorus japonicus TaxID=55135 RepID=UPI00398F0222
MRRQTEAPSALSVMTFSCQHETNVPTDCFPIRKIFKGGYQSAGHWVKAQKDTKHKAFQAVLCSKSSPSCRPQTSVETKAQSYDVPPTPDKKQVLDGNFLMQLHCVDNQSDLCVVNISDQDLDSVIEEDFKLFDSVAYIHAAANHLPFEPFNLFPAIRELDLTVNGVQNLCLTTRDFPHLEVLNLSYNNLTHQDILELGILPQLKTLHLTGNDLDSLPPDLTVPFDPLDWSEQAMPRFRALEVLMLDDNRFSDPCVFSSLANLHRLTYLNLDQNSFTGVPYLQQMKSSSPLEKPEGAPLCQSIISQLKSPGKCPTADLMASAVFRSDFEVNRTAREITEKDEEEEKEEEKEEEEEDEEEEMEVEEEDINDDFSSFSSAPSVELSTVNVSNVQGQATKKQLVTPPQKKPMCFPKLKNEFLPPFSKLTHLSLAKNKIWDDEELLAVCLFPALNKLTIYKNPLTVNPGNQLLVIALLESRIGINVICNKPRPPEKPPLMKAFALNRKVGTRIPKIPKEPVMLEAADPLPELDRAEEGASQRGDTELETPAPATDICTELMSALLSSCASEDLASQDTIEGKKVDGFFMTQVDDGTLKREEEETAKEMQTETPSVTTDFPDRYRGYEELLDAETDPYFVEPIGIQQNVRRLDRCLRKLQLYPDPFARVNLQQESYVSKERKLRMLPEAKFKSRADKMEAILKQLKEQRAMTVIPLARVLRGEGASRQEYEEAVTLLRELQLVYKATHELLAANMKGLHEGCEMIGGGGEIQMPEVSPEGPADQPGPSASQG